MWLVELSLLVGLGIVEGEPGIFPDPIARLLRWFSRLFRRRAR